MPGITLIEIGTGCRPAEGGGGPKAPDVVRQNRPVSGCELLAEAGFPDGFPMPGTAEFCNAMDGIKDGLERVADGFFGWIQDPGIIKDAAAYLKFNTKNLGLTSFIKPILDSWNILVDMGVNVSTFVLDINTFMLRQGIRLHDCITKQFNPKAMRGLWVLKQIVKALDKLRLGIDPVVWITADISLAFDLVERWLDQVEHYLAPLEIPSPEAATRAWLLDRIDKIRRDCIWKLHGLNPDTYEPFALVDREQLDWREAIQYVRRLKLPEAAEDYVLRKRGFTEDADVGMAKEMYWELPSIADHLHWLQRQVFDKDYVARYRLMDGFNEKFWPAFGGDLTALGMRQEYAKNHYAAHWIMPSPEQMKEFLYRSGEINAATGQPFTLDDFERILAEQDYNVLARGWFRATAYNVPAISYIKEWYRQGIIDKQQLQTYHQALGFNPKDAENFVKIDDLQKKRMRASQTHGWTTKSATDAWFWNQIDDAAHTQHYVDLGYTAAEASEARSARTTAFNAQITGQMVRKSISSLPQTLTAALRLGVISPQQMEANLVQTGWPQAAAHSYSQSQGAAASVSRLQQGITYLRRRVIDGTVDLPTAAQELTQLGLQPAAVQDYVKVWTLLMTTRRKHRSAQQVSNDLAQGHIGRAEAIARLRNLGYDDADTRLYLADAQGKLQKINEGRLKAADKAGLQRQKQLEKVAKAADKAHKDVIKAMMKELPVAKLDRFAKLGIIGKDFYLRRMALYGYGSVDAQHYYTAACAGKGAACKDHVDGQADTVRGSGGTGNPPPAGK